MRRIKYITEPDNSGQVLFRILSSIIARQLAKFNVSPNQVTISRLFINILALFCFSRGNFVGFASGFVLFQVFEVLDHVDGDLARFTGKQSKVGVLLEQFIDTYGSRPSNIFGLSIALGFYHQTSNMMIFLLYILIALGRLLWLEYRDYFGWYRNIHGVVIGKNDLNNPLATPKKGTLQEKYTNIFLHVYTWQNQLVLWGALLQVSVNKTYRVDLLIWVFILLVILNHMPWIAIVISGFKKALEEDHKAHG